MDPLLPSKEHPLKTSVQLKENIARDFSQLFGFKQVNGRSYHVEQLIEELARKFASDFKAIAKARRDFLSSPAQVAERYSFLAADQVIQDSDGQTLSIAEIRQGMIDNFLGKPTRMAWRLNQNQPIPAEVMRPGLQGTGPFDDLGMAMSALNAGTASWMADWEDAGNDYQDKLYRAWKNLSELLAGEWDNQVYHHPEKNKDYRVLVQRESWPTLFHRVPGLHLQNRQIWVDDQPVPAMIPALVLHTLNNFDSQASNDSGIYFYIPKIETAKEALLVARILKELEETLGLDLGTLKIEMLNERARYAANQEAIMWVLRYWLVGPNVGRWDYLNSRIEMGKDDPSLTFPDPHQVGMAEASMTAYTRRNALLTLLVGGFPVGGMSAVMKNPRQSEEVNAKAVRSIWFDKLRERLTGLFLYEDELFDTYRQSWVATTEDEYVRAGEEPLTADFDPQAATTELQALVDSCSPQELSLLEQLALVQDGQIVPYRLRQQALGDLYSREAWEELFRRPQGETTEEGLRYAIYMASEYMFQQLNGNNAAAIEDYLSGNRLMNDFATYEIFWHWLWTAVRHEVPLTQDGETTRKGEPVSRQLLHRLLDERTDAVEAFFAEQDRQGIVSRFDRTKAPIVMDLLRRQLDHDHWIMYGSRILLSIVECDVLDREQILEAIFSASREAVEQKVTDKKLNQNALKAYDYVYDLQAFIDSGAETETDRTNSSSN